MTAVSSSAPLAGPTPDQPAAAKPELAKAERAKRRSAAVVIAATLLGGAAFFANLGHWSSDRATAIEASVRDGEKRLADVEAKRKAAESKLAEVEKVRAETERAAADNARRVSELDGRRADLQKQVAELAGPVSAGPSEAALDEAAPQPQAPTPVAAAPADDPSPPDEAAPETLPRVAAAEQPAPAAAMTEAAQATPLSNGPVRVFIHVQSTSSGARDRARAVAAELKRRGVEVADIRGVRLPIRRDALRYFYDADREAVSALEQAVRDASSPGAQAPQAQDFRGYRASPKQGTIELWLS